MKYTPINKGSLLGYADLYVHKMGLEIYGCSLHEKNGHKWLNFPSREYINDAGEKKYASIIKFKEKSHMEMFQKLAITAIEKNAQT